VSLAKPPSQNSIPSSSENLVFAKGWLCADFRPLSGDGLLRNPNGELMSERPELDHPARVGRLRSLGAVLGCEADGAPKRITLKSNYAEPFLPFSDRMQWLAKVQRLIATHSCDGKSFPHKVGSVAYAIAHVGNVCRLGLDGIAERAGCVVNTAQACIAWLKEQGAFPCTISPKLIPLSAASLTNWTRSVPGIGLAVPTAVFTAKSVAKLGCLCHFNANSFVRRTAA
jgi:hypothetical protein